MKIFEALELNLDEKLIISLVGGGGKSTTMDRMAKEFKSMGKRVLVTTTTMLFYHEHKEYDEFILGELPEIYNPLEGSITLLGSGIIENELGDKIIGIDLEELEEIYNRNIFDVILIEADGARLKPIKAPAIHEPVVPIFNNITIGLIGLDSIGKELIDENVHRPEILISLLEVEEPHFIDEEDIAKLVLHEEGLFKGTYGETILFLNKASNEELLELGRKIGEKIVERGFREIYITNVIDGRVEKI